MKEKGKGKRESKGEGGKERGREEEEKSKREGERNTRKHCGTARQYNVGIHRLRKIDWTSANCLLYHSIGRCEEHRW